MTKVKSLLPDDYTIESNLGDTAQEQAELTEFMQSLEGRLIEFTTQELVEEIHNRTWRELDHLQVVCNDLRDKLDNFGKAPF